MANEHTKARTKRILDKHRLPDFDKHRLAENVAARFAQSSGFKAMAENLALNAMAKLFIEFLEKRPGRKVILQSTSDGIDIMLVNEKGQPAEPNDL